MKVLAIHNLKGGVGKTAAAVNLAWLAAHHGLRTLLWDLDAQGAASYYFRLRPRVTGAAALIGDKQSLRTAACGTDYERLDVVPADVSYRNLDLELGEYRKGHVRLARLLRRVADDYDLIILDCAPSMSLVSENIFNMADVVLVPLIPTHLSLRAYAQLREFRDRHVPEGAAVVPFFSMVDRRKQLHRQLVVDFAAREPALLRSYVPYASEIERMGEHQAPIHTYADRAPGGRAFRALWAALAERFALTTKPA
jgi:cellulose biosynthesis protein BcsQ